MKYTPYDDTQSSLRSGASVEAGYSTSGWDLYRQGIEISTDRFRFMGSQPKFWSGNTSGYTDVVTYGQNPGSIESNVTGLESMYQDMPKFNPAAYIQLGAAYPLPIIFNDGPGEQLEATIEPFAIPFKKHSNEGPVYAHAVRAEMEGGNRQGNSTNIAEQFIELNPVESLGFFLDEGADYFGNIPKEPYIADIAAASTPFDDTLSQALGNRLTSTDETLRQIIIGAGDSTEDLLPYGKKSASAGGSYYGPNTALYGTDSITFAGWSAGS